jgi:twitching motility protein PilT
MSLYLSNLKEILAYAIEKNAADINIIEEMPLSFRINKSIVKLKENIIQKEVARNAVRELTCSDSAYVDLYKPIPIDGSYKFTYMNKNYYFRYNITLAERKIALSIRKLINEVPDFSNIQMNEPNMIKYIERMNKIPEGLFLIVGATGSGKSTTIVTALDYILKNNAIKLITLESPIEFYFNDSNYEDSIVLQREIGKDVESFYQGLVDAMRQNPDVIFVGEIRDKKTAEAALNAALTGHMVVATLHASGINKTFDRMKYLLDGITDDFSFIEGIVFQKLIKDEKLGVKAVRDVYLKK